jgi:hypothetical protein
MKKSWQLFFIFFLPLLSCTYSKKAELQLPLCATVNSSYSQNIAPLIATRCALSGCHNSDSIPLGNFNNYISIKKRVDNGLFKTKVLDTKLMPPFSQPALTTEEYNKLNCWYQAGAPPN